MVQSSDLFQALQAGHLFGAGLDVWWQYPPRNALEAGGLPPTTCPPSACDFASLGNVVMSPHRGGAPSVAEVEEVRWAEVDAILCGVVAGGWASLSAHPALYSMEEGY